MSLLSKLFKSSRKVNLTPDVTPLTPAQINPALYGSLSELARKYQEGPGFGDDFLSRTTSAPIASREARFKDIELPQISSQLSSRGLARSAGPNLATDVISRATSQKERDINDLISQFYLLNERQKKADTSFGANLGQNILTGDVAQHNQIAAASERLAGATAADARSRDTTDRATAGNLLGAATTIAAPALAPLGAGLGGALDSIGLGGFAQSVSPIFSSLNQGVTQIGTRTLDDNNLGILEQLLKKKGLI